MLHRDAAPVPCREREADGNPRLEKKDPALASRGRLREKPESAGRVGSCRGTWEKHFWQEVVLRQDLRPPGARLWAGEQ